MSLTTRRRDGPTTRVSKIDGRSIQRSNGIAIAMLAVKPATQVTATVTL
jgi:hypothetical protein